ncbi:MAG TPA: hypothetical protein VNA12_10230 [Mycobacteriales bacterium]|nr:hypothetical protein [Mycobacteriales bacterium]
MIEEDVISRLVGLHDHIRPPVMDVASDVLRGRRVLRRRRAVAGAAVGLVAVAVAVTLVPATTGAPKGVDHLDEVPPSQTSAPTQDARGSWSLERIRAEGSPTDVLPTAGSAVSARLYVAYDGPVEQGGPPYSNVRAALEVTHDARSALFDYRYSTANQPWVARFADDTVLVQDAEWVPFGQARPVRYRLLQADGDAVELRMLEGRAPAAPGPGVVQIDDFSSWSAGGSGAEELYVVDTRAGTLQPLDVPEDIRYWGPNVGEFLWGVTSDCRVFAGAAGRFAEHRLECAPDTAFTVLSRSWFPDGWLRPGRMALAEVHLTEADTPASPVYLHISRDNGATWQRIAVSDDTAIAAELQRIG